MKHAGSAGAGTEDSSKSNNQESPDSKASGNADKDDDIVDADFEVVDEADKKSKFCVRFQIFELVRHNLTYQTKPKKRKMSKVKNHSIGRSCPCKASR